METAALVILGAILAVGLVTFFTLSRFLKIESQNHVLYLSILEEVKSMRERVDRLAGPAKTPGSDKPVE